LRRLEIAARILSGGREVGLAMVEVLSKGYPKKILDVNDIVKPAPDAKRPQ